MGYMVAISACFGCSRVFGYNPDLVPSIEINGVREPVCQNCVDRANPQRIANGLDPIEVLPGAYAEQEVDLMYGVYNPKIGSDSGIVCETEGAVLDLLNLLDDRREILPGELTVREPNSVETDAHDWLAATE